MPTPVPCHPVAQRGHGLVVARAAGAPALAGTGCCVPRAALGTRSLLPAPVPARPRDTAVPPPSATASGCATTVCHGLCHDRGRVPRPPCPSGPSRGRSQHNPPLSGPAQPALCLADTKGLRGAGGAGRGLPASDTRVSGSSARPPAPPRGSCCPQPLGWAPRERRGPRKELPSLTRKVLMWQSLARSHWSRSAPQGPPRTGRPRRPPESPRRSRGASPSPAPACCRSPSADVSEAPSWGP